MRIHGDRRERPKLIGILPLSTSPLLQLVSICCAAARQVEAHATIERHKFNMISEGIDLPNLIGVVRSDAAPFVDLCSISYGDSGYIETGSTYRGNDLISATVVAADGLQAPGLCVRSVAREGFNWCAIRRPRSFHVHTRRRTKNADHPVRAWREACLGRAFGRSSLRGGSESCKSTPRWNATQCDCT